MTPEPGPASNRRGQLWRSGSSKWLFALNAVYMFMIIAHPTDVYPWLGEIHFQRLWMLMILGLTFLSAARSRKPAATNLWLLAFCAVLYVSSFTSPVSNLAFTTTNDYVKLVVFYFVLLWTTEDEEALRWTVVVFLLCKMIYMLLSMREFFFFGQHVYDMGVIRMKGWDYGTGPNRLALQLAISVPFAVLLLGQAGLRAVKSLETRPLLRNAALIGAAAHIALVCVAVVLTQSRSGMVVLLGYAVFTMLRGAKRIGLVALIVACMLLFFSMLPDDTKNRYMTLLGGGPPTGLEELDDSRDARASLHKRWQGIVDAFRTFKEYPVLGVGPGVFTVTSTLGEQSHNLFGQLAAETGSCGLFCFLGFGASCYVAGRRRAKKSRSEGRESGFPDALDRAVLHSGGLLLLGSLFAHTAFWQTWLLFAAFLVLAGQVAGRPPELRGQHQPQQPGPRPPA